MLRVAAFLLGVCLIACLFGCGESCESVQKEIDAIGRSIQKDPQKAMESSKQLSELKDKMREMGCLR